jgi:hypothetical protein
MLAIEKQSLWYWLVRFFEGLFCLAAPANWDHADVTAALRAGYARLYPPASSALDPAALGYYSNGASTSDVIPLEPERAWRRAEWRSPRHFFELKQKRIAGSAPGSRDATDDLRKIGAA